MTFITVKFICYARTRTEGTSPQNETKKPTAVSVNCASMPAGKEITPCVPWQKPCLFDLIQDPCETNNIASIRPAQVKALQDSVQAIDSTYLPMEYKNYDSDSHPDNWNGW